MKVFADSMFTFLREKGIKNLIIDLRNNGGGDSQVGDVLFRYISHQPFKQMGKTLVRVTPTTQRLMNNNQLVSAGVRPFRVYFLTFILSASIKK